MRTLVDTGCTTMLITQKLVETWSGKNSMVALDRQMWSMLESKSNGGHRCCWHNYGNKCVQSVERCSTWQRESWNWPGCSVSMGCRQVKDWNSESGTLMIENKYGIYWKRCTVEWRWMRELLTLKTNMVSYENISTQEKRLAFNRWKGGWRKVNIANLKAVIKVLKMRGGGKRH